MALASISQANVDAETLLQNIGGCDRFTFQTFDDSPQKRKRLSRILHGNLSQHAGTLERLNHEGAGVFFMVNAGDGKGRSKTNVQRVNAVFVDLDGSPLLPVQKAPIQPHVTIESSPDRYHAYWAVDGIALDEFASVQDQLALKFHGDRKVKDLPRVMRMPGFWHQKSTPYLTRILEIGANSRYGRSDFLEAMQVSPSKDFIQIKQVIPEGERNETLFRMAASHFAKGRPSQTVLERLLKLNQSRCEPPLPEDEVRGIVERASRPALDTFISVPHSVIDAPEFRNLSPRAQSLFYLTMRRFNGANNGAIGLPHSEFRHLGFNDAKSLAKAIRDLIAAKMLFRTREATFGKESEHRLCALYGIEFLRGFSP